MFYNLFSRKKKITSPAAAPEEAIQTVANPQVESSVELVTEPAVQPVIKPAEGYVELPVSAMNPRTARATSPRTSTAKVAPPKAAPATRPGSKPAAKPITGVAPPPTSTPNRVNKPSKQGLLDAMAAAPSEVPRLGEAAAPSLPALTVPQLRLRARELGLVGYSRLPKAELLRVITEKLNADGPVLPPENPPTS